MEAFWVTQALPLVGHRSELKLEPRRPCFCVCVQPSSVITGWQWEFKLHCHMGVMLLFHLC